MKINMFETLYKPCWVKNGKTKCFYSCITIERTDKILLKKIKENDELKILNNQSDNEFETIVMPCSSFLPEFIDKEAVNSKQKKPMKNFMGSKKLIKKIKFYNNF